MRSGQRREAFVLATTSVQLQKWGEVLGVKHKRTLFSFSHIINAARNTDYYDKFKHFLSLKEVDVGMFHT